jgi:hypothetical protein
LLDKPAGTRCVPAQNRRAGFPLLLPILVTIIRCRSATAQFSIYPIPATHTHTGWDRVFQPVLVGRGGRDAAEEQLHRSRQHNALIRDIYSAMKPGRPQRAAVSR